MNIDDRWITQFERSGCIHSPRYDDSIKYFRQFEDASSIVRMFSIGRSPQGRSIECLVIGKGKEFTPRKAKASGKAIVLIQNGIHAGEIEGKDASMILLRDILITKELNHLLDHLVMLVIPVLNVDGHERVSGYNRPNQNGPDEMGWRTNSWNLNLNRDYLKADTPEIRSFLKLFNEWKPDFFIDNHTTNGADYQYHITYALEKSGNIDMELGKWGSKKFLPDLLRSVEQKGFITAPYIEFRQGTIESGIQESPALPRLSTGYAAVQNRLGLLVETHSLKPYENRVRSTYAMNAAALDIINSHHLQILRMNKKADTFSSKARTVPVEFELSNKSNPFIFKGFKSEYEYSSITGDNVIRYTDEPVEIVIPHFRSVMETKRIRLPKAYVVPKEFDHLIKILLLHGVKVEKLSVDKDISVEQYSFIKTNFSQKPYEGRFCVEVECNANGKKEHFPKGTYIVRMNQPANRVIVNLLEPEAPDSFLHWGFFNAYFERKEYAEAYVMEPVAKKMLDSSKQLRAEFTARLDDEEFRNDPNARLDFFYQRSPFFDIHEKKYPIYRVL